jgi:hypothetical protein
MERPRMKDLGPGCSAWTEPSALWFDGKDLYYIDGDVPISDRPDERFRLRVEHGPDRMTIDRWHCPYDKPNLIDETPLPEIAYPAIDITPDLGA